MHFQMIEQRRPIFPMALSVQSIPFDGDRARGAICVEEQEKPEQ
jgi:hypothetical protein